MDDDTEKSDLERIAELLARHGVEYIVIGGQAETLFGSPRVTFDVDLCYRRTRQNMERLAAALHELKPKLRGAPRDLPFIIDARTLELGGSFTFDIDDLPLDILAWVEPIGDYEALMQRAEVADVSGMKLNVISLEDLIRVKQHVNRPKDRDSLWQLLAIRRLREEGRK